MHLTSVFSLISVDLLCEQHKLRDAFLSALRLQVTVDCKKLRDDGYKVYTDIGCYMYQAIENKKALRVLQLCIIEAGSIRVR